MMEVFQTLHQLGMEACPVCRSTDALSMSPLPAIILDGDLPSAKDDLDLAPWEEPGGDLTFAVRIECTVCGHLMLFNAQKFRSAGEKILRLEADQEHES
jgi:Zn ribbon nucleic-acid-binding protein